MRENLVWRKLQNCLKLNLIQADIIGYKLFNCKGAEIYPNKLKAVKNVLSLIAFLSCGIATVFVRYTYKTSVFIYQTTDIIILGLATLYSVICWTAPIINSKKHIKLIKELVSYDKDLTKCGNVINYFEMERSINRHFLIRLVWTIVALLIQVITMKFLPDSNWEVPMLIVFYFPVIFNNTTCGLVSMYILLIKKRCSMLNQQIKPLILPQSISSIRLEAGWELQVLNNVCRFHHRLMKLIRLVNECFGVICLVLFGYSFVCIVIGLYYFCFYLKSRFFYWRGIINSATIFLCYTIDVVYLCHICHSTIEEVKLSGVQIHKIETDNLEIKDEIEMFSLQIANEQAEFNAAGFFPINYTLLFSIIGGVTTYIIILIQLTNPILDIF